MSEKTDKKEAQGWACVAKALNEFEGTRLIQNFLHASGEFCAVGAALHVAKVSDVTKQDFHDNTESVPLYKEFEKRFNIKPAHVYNVNDGTPGLTNEERLIYMRAYANARAESLDHFTAEDVALKHVASKKPKQEY